MDAELEVLAIQRFKEEIFPPLVSRLAEEQERLRYLTLRDFHDVVGEIVAEALNSLRQILELKQSDALEKGLRGEVTRHILSQLNSVLPLDHPYLVAVVDLEDEPGLIFTVITRTQELRIRINRPDIIAVCFAESREEIKRGNLTIVLQAP